MKLGQIFFQLSQGSKKLLHLMLKTCLVKLQVLFQMMKERVEQFDQVDEVDVNVVWDPVWTMDRLSDSARKKLTLPLEELIPLREKRLAEQQKGG